MEKKLWIWVLPVRFTSSKLSKMCGYWQQ